MKNPVLKLAAKLAIMVTTKDANNCCTFIAYQPKLPENAKKLKKF
ncbi:MAG: cyclic lactone autoinducer peptide [Anaerocolumna sp.]